MYAISPSRPTPSRQSLELAGNQRLLVERVEGQNFLKIVGADGLVRLSIHISPAGPILRLEGPGLLIQADGPLAIDAEQVSIHAREGLSLSSGADAEICAAGNLTTQANAQIITAHLGNVSLSANDDVTLNGERIRMNC